MLNIRLEGKLPIYEQLYNGISRLISSGELEPDERLPAVRSTMTPKVDFTRPTPPLLSMKRYRATERFAVWERRLS